MRLTAEKRPRYDIAAMNDSFCPGCGTSLDLDDNFCRHCGIAAGRAALPALRPQASTTIWQPSVSPVVRGAAVMAAGTVGQFLLRRVVRGLVDGSASRRPSGGIQLRRNRRDDDGMVDEAQIITETVMMRRVRVRRPAD